MRKKYRITACVGHNLLNIISAITEKALGIFYNNSNVKGPPLPDRPFARKFSEWKACRKTTLVVINRPYSAKVGG